MTEGCLPEESGTAYCVTDLCTTARVTNNPYLLAVVVTRLLPFHNPACEVEAGEQYPPGALGATPAGAASTYAGEEATSRRRLPSGRNRPAREELEHGGPCPASAAWPAARPEGGLRGLAPFSAGPGPSRLVGGSSEGTEALWGAPPCSHIQEQSHISAWVLLSNRPPKTTCKLGHS